MSKYRPRPDETPAIMPPSFGRWSRLMLWMCVVCSLMPRPCRSGRARTIRQHPGPTLERYSGAGAVPGASLLGTGGFAQTLIARDSPTSLTMRRGVTEPRRTGAGSWREEGAAREGRPSRSVRDARRLLGADRIRHDPDVRPRGLPALGPELLRGLVVHGAGDDHVLARLPVHRRRNL